MGKRLGNIIVGWLASFCTVSSIALIIDINSDYAYNGRDAAVVAVGTLTGILIAQIFD